MPFQKFRSFFFLPYPPYDGSACSRTYLSSVFHQQMFINQTLLHMPVVKQTLCVCVCRIVWVWRRWTKQGSWFFWPPKATTSSSKKSGSKPTCCLIYTKAAPYLLIVSDCCSCSWNQEQYNASLTGRSSLAESIIYSFCTDHFQRVGF